MDDDALAEPSSTARGRWLRPASVGAVCLALVAALTIVVVTMRDGQRAVPGPADPPPNSVRITGTGMLLQQPGQDITLCVGGIMLSLPPQCGNTVAVTGVGWAQVPGATTASGVTYADVTVTGWWSDDVLDVEKVTTPERGSSSPTEDLPGPLCSNPTGTSRGALDGGPGEAAEALPGFQGMWVTYPDGLPARESEDVRMVYNVAVLDHVDEATRRLRASFSGLLCVGTIPGLSQQAAMDAANKLAAHATELGLLSFGPSLQGGRSGLSVSVFLATDEMVARIHDAVGREAAAFTTVTGQFRIVE